MILSHGRLYSILFTAMFLALGPLPSNAFSVSKVRTHGHAPAIPASFPTTQKPLNNISLNLFSSRRAVHSLATSNSNRLKVRKTRRMMFAALTVLLRRTRRAVAFMAFAVCVWMSHQHAAHATPNVVSQQQTDIVVSTKQNGKVIAVCGGVVLTNELYKRSMKQQGSDDSLSSPGGNDNVDNVLTRPARALEQVEPLPTKEPLMNGDKSLTNSTNVSTDSVSFPVDSSTSTDSITQTSNKLPLPTNEDVNMTTVQKLQQRVENAATKMEGKLQEWSTRSSPAIESLPKPATISLQRTSAGTSSTGSPSIESATKTLTKPVKITIPPLPAAKPRTTMTAPATATSPTAPFSTALTAVSPATAVATSVAAPVKSTSAPTLTELPLAVASTMASVPLSPPSYKETPTKQPLQVIDQDKPTVKVAGSGDQLPPLSVMGFDANGRVLTSEPTKNSMDTQDTSTSSSKDTPKSKTGSPKHEALRAIGFGNASPGSPATDAKTSNQQPSVAKDTDQVSRSSTSSFVSSAPAGKSGTSAATKVEKKERPIIMQPRPPDEEVALQQKYAAIDDVGERAYQILIDLSMI